MHLTLCQQANACLIKSGTHWALIYYIYRVIFSTNRTNIPSQRKKSNKIQQRIKILLFRIYIKLNTFWVTNRSSSGA